MKISSQIMQEKYFHGDDVIDDDLKVVSLYSLMNKKITFFVITE